MEHRAYTIAFISFGLFYFLDVFIGMLLLNTDYASMGPFAFDLIETNYGLIERPYDVIEVVLLAIMIVENVVKIGYSSS